MHLFINAIYITSTLTRHTICGLQQLVYEVLNYLFINAIYIDVGARYWGTCSRQVTAYLKTYARDMLLKSQRQPI
jgi:hypothetical protein